jgi:hypothetical protein
MRSLAILMAGTMFSATPLQNSRRDRNSRNPTSHPKLFSGVLGRNGSLLEILHGSRSSHPSLRIERNRNEDPRTKPSMGS